MPGLKTLESNMGGSVIVLLFLRTPRYSYTMTCRPKTPNLIVSPQILGVRGLLSVGQASGILGS